MNIQSESESESKAELMEPLIKEIKECKKCDLWKTRNKPLVGDGPVHADILVIGESPGYYEDLQGRAFVGEAGKILDQLLEIANLTRKEIYITNVLKCHPPRNHNPNRQEIDACIEYLYRQIEIIKPKIILTLGKFASKEVFEKFNLGFSRISEIHGRAFEAGSTESLGKIRIIPLYHPAVACYHNEMLDVLKKDFEELKKVLSKE